MAKIKTKKTNTRSKSVTSRPRTKSQISSYNDSRVRGAFQKLRRNRLFVTAFSVFLVFLLGFTVMKTIQNDPAYAYSTLYAPNEHANATLLACKDNNTVRLKYTGNDSPLIRLKTGFGPNISKVHTEKLKKYTKNWTWTGSYKIPEKATTIKITMIYDDYTRDNSSMSIAELDACGDGKPGLGKETKDQSTPNSTPKTNNNPGSNSSGSSGGSSGSGSTSTPAPAPVPTPTPVPSPSSVKPLTPGTTWQWQLTGTINTATLDKSTNNKKMYDIDLEDTSVSTISALKAKGIIVICYFSAGTSENWRSDYSKFPSTVKGSKVDGWAGENWLDVRNLGVLMPIMTARMDTAVNKGCDGLEPDNVDAYTNKSGFPLTANDQKTYLISLANEAHKRNLSIGLKNNIDQVSELSSTFDWALNEQCYQYNECGVYSAFINKNKAVFGVEYSGSTSSFCSKANASNFDWLLKGIDLGATPRTACRNG